MALGLVPSTKTGWRGRASHHGDNERPTRVAQYVRMFTDHERYATENQCDIVNKCTAQYGTAIVQTYAHEGKSGLSAGYGLQRLLLDENRLPKGLPQRGNRRDRRPIATRRLCDQQGIKWFPDKEGGPWTTMALINKAGGLFPADGKAAPTHSPDDV